MSYLLALLLIIILAILALSLADAVDRFSEWVRDRIVELLDKP